METLNFPEILNGVIVNHWNNVLKVPKYARDVNGNYYLKEV
jgi:hypothetical protein